jgi:hypothetical protein
VPASSVQRADCRSKNGVVCVEGIEDTDWVGPPSGWVCLGLLAPASVQKQKHEAFFV